MDPWQRRRSSCFTTGGTVAATTTADGAVPALSAADLLPDLSTPRTDPLPDITVSAVDLMSVDSSAMTSADRSRIIGAIGDTLPIRKSWPSW